MEFRQLGKSDLKVSVISFGCWAMGAGESNWGWRSVNDKESIASVHAAIDAEINLFDTAEQYGDGKSEMVLGKALKGNRDKVLISSKVFRNHLKKEELVKALEGSLARLGTGYVDIYYIHWPNPEVPLQETMEALLKLKEQGKIRVVGVSNFSVSQMMECLECGRIEALQPPYHLFWRYIEEDIIPFCIKNEIGIFAYSPLAQGLLTGKFKSAEEKFSDIRSHNLLFQVETFRVALEQVEKLREIAKNYGKTPAQTALNWTFNQPGITSAIVGAKHPTQLRENIGAAGWKISQEDLLVMDRMSKTVMGTLKDKIKDKNPNFWY